MSQANNPLHGVKLAHMVEALVEYWGWEQLALRIPVRCYVRPFSKIDAEVPEKDALGADKGGTALPRYLS